MRILQETVRNNSETNDTEQQWRHTLEMRNARIPSITILVIQILVCVLGNTLVIYILRRRMSSHPELWYFIPWLAVFDIVASIIGGTLALLQDIFSMSFPSKFLCQTLWFGIVISTSTGASCLLIVAVQRFIYVFNRTPISLKWRRLAIIITVISAVIVALPVFYVVEVTDITYQGVKGQVCRDTTDKQKVKYKTSYFHFLLFLACFNIVVISILYIKIGVKTYQLLIPHEEGRQSWASRKRVGLNFTLMCAVVFVVYSVAYIPTTVIILLADETKTELFHDIENKVTLNGILVAHRMFLFSHLLNPFIFFFFNAKVRKEVKDFALGCKSQCTKPRQNYL